MTLILLKSHKSLRLHCCCFLIVRNEKLRGVGNLKLHNTSCKFREFQADSSKHEMEDPLTDIRTHKGNMIGDFESFWERKINYITTN
jgi:hypothetical protein